MSFYDLDELADGVVIRSSVCIIGSGAAGITLALDLSRSGVGVTLLEAGDRQFDPQAQLVYEGKIVGRPYYDLTRTRLRRFGGTTNHWTGWCRPFEPIDFEERDWVRWSGWPFGMEEMEPYYKEAHLLCELTSSNYGFQHWSSLLEVDELPIGDWLFSSSVLQQSAPTRFGHRYENELLETQNVDIYLHANVVNLETNSSGTAVERIHVRDDMGASAVVEADVVVLAMGGMENPRLLLASQQSGADKFGNAHDLVGRFFSDHPHVKLGTVTTSPLASVDAYTGAQETSSGAIIIPILILQEDVQEGLSLLNGSIQLNDPAQESLHELAAKGTSEAVRALLEDMQDIQWRRELDVTVVSEQAPNPHSRLTLTRERDRFGVPRIALDWRLMEMDWTSIRKMTELVGHQFGGSGLGRLHSRANAPERWSVNGGHHHMGTTRMHPNHRQGVVDENCRVHGMRNLFVAGSSVFPTFGFANPTLTIVALALRLGAYLRGAGP